MFKKFVLLSVLFYSFFTGLCPGMLNNAAIENTAYASHDYSKVVCVDCDEVETDQVGCCATHTIESEKQVIALSRSNDTPPDTVAVIPSLNNYPEPCEVGNSFNSPTVNLYIDPHKQLSLPKIE